MAEYHVDIIVGFSSSSSSSLHAPQPGCHARSCGLLRPSCTHALRAAASRRKSSLRQGAPAGVAAPTIRELKVTAVTVAELTDRRGCRPVSRPAGLRAHPPCPRLEE